MQTASAQPGDFRFADLIDIPAFARILETFFKATGIPNGVVDASGELLTQAGWMDACTVFHRSHPESEQRCQESNITLMHDLRQGQAIGRQCDNGLMDYATPVIVEGRLLATLFLGQVFHQPPDMDFFRAQAARYSHNEADYLAAIRKIPIIPREQIECYMSVMVGMAQMLTESGLARLRQIKLEENLSSTKERQIQLEDILNFSPVAIGWSDGEGCIEYVNQQFTHLFGYTLADFSDLESWYRQAYPDTHYRKTHIQPWRQAVADARKLNMPAPELEANITCKDGSIRHVNIRVAWVGERRLVSFTDITERWLSEQRILSHDAMLEMIARSTPLPDILLTIVQQIEREDSTAICSILLLDEDGRHLRTGAAPSLPEAYNQAVDGLTIGMGVGSCGTAAFLGERVIVENILTHEYWQPYLAVAELAQVQACWSEPIRSSSGQIYGTFAIYHREPTTPTAKDIERISFAANLCSIAIENRYAHRELERRAYSDYLTGLSNRRSFIEKAESELQRGLRYGGELSILMLDIDRFKQVNDTYGHKVGDSVLQKLAEVCRHTLRAIDISGRIGGEEFAILLPGTGIKPAMEAAERLRVALSEAEIPLDSGLPLRITVSIGVVTLQDKPINIDTLLSQADEALYQAKNSGRNRVCQYEKRPAAH